MTRPRYLTGLLTVIALLLGLNLLVTANSSLPEAHASSGPPLNAAAQRKAIQEEIAGLREDVRALKQTLESGKVRVQVQALPKD